MTRGVTSQRRTPVRAPELVGDLWLNTGGEQVRLADLRGKIVLLDFWTSGCINCLHVLDELRPLEEEFADVLVTIGVHSPKFLHEGERSAIEASVRRYGVAHPVLNDPDLTTWQRYAVKAWPTLVVIDPDGYIAHVAAGEGHGEALRRVVAELVATHTERGTVRSAGSPYVAIDEAGGDLRFPAKAISSVDGRTLVADTANHSLVELDGDDSTVLRRFGSGQRGASDGPASKASFTEPSGIAVLPTHIADRVGYHLVVADTGGHLLRGVDLDTGAVSTVAGTGTQWRDGDTEGKAGEVDLTSPWDVIWYPAVEAIVVAMAGNHTLGLFDPVHGTVSRFAGTTVEGLRDGPVGDAFFAQTSGLAVSGDRLWLVDAETSALRWVEPDAAGFSVHTAVGTDLFSFGHADGDAAQALLQHPLGVAVLADGAIAIADTYNGVVRRYDPASNAVTTLAGEFAEPSGLLVRDGSLVVVESAAHQLSAVPDERASTVHGDAHTVRRPPTELAPGEVDFEVVFSPPPGEKLDERYGPSTRLEISASPPDLLVDGAGAGSALRRTLRLAEGHTDGVIQVVAQAASCDEDAQHPVCRMSRQDWGVPVRLRAGAPSSVQLVMAGTAEGSATG